MKYEFTPRGVCSRHFVFDIEDDIVNDVEIIGGCNGNLQGISSLIKGMNIDDIIEKLGGINCGMKGTSCPDQIARALSEYQQNN